MHLEFDNTSTPFDKVPMKSNQDQQWMQCDDQQMYVQVFVFGSQTPMLHKTTPASHRNYLWAAKSGWA